MEARQIIDDFRREADDRVEPYHASNEDCLAWLSEAEREAALRARLIYEHVNADLCAIQVVPNQASYSIDPRWFAVEAVALDRTASMPGSEIKPLAPINTLQAATRGVRVGGSMPPIPNQPWWFYGKGNSRVEAFSIDGQTLTLFCTPDTTFDVSQRPAAIHLAGYRLPLYDLEDLADEPEIPAMHHDGLVHWLLYRNFSRKDLELQDDQRAMRALAMFEQRFGPRPSAVQLRKFAERRRWTTVPNGR